MILIRAAICHPPEAMCRGIPMAMAAAQQEATPAVAIISRDEANVAAMAAGAFTRPVRKVKSLAV